MDPAKPNLDSNILNLSQKDLTKNEKKLLNKGLNFIPTPKTVDQNDLDDATKEIGRKIKIAYYFQDDLRNKFRHIPKFKKKSSWSPPDNQILGLVKDKIVKMENEIKAIRIQKENPNLKKSELKALKQLRHDTSIVIKPADKGSATVILDKKEYIAEGIRQLSIKNHYRKLEQPIFKKTASKIDAILKKLLKESRISDSQYDYLKPDQNPRERRLYFLPKIHKDIEKWPVPNKMPPGRPIVSDCESESYKVSEYIDSFLNPLATNHPSYLKDTQDFLTKINQIKIPENSLLVTLDVESLYTNINNEEGMAAVAEAFAKSKRKDFTSMGRPDKEILELLKLSLENNDFMFNNEWYLQISGTAMGKKFAPNYANIYMAKWERDALSKTKKKPLIYLRFLDDIFIIWTHSEKDFWEFFEVLNNHSESIKLKAEIQSTEINFLDVTLFKGDRFKQTGYIDTKVYFKPTDTHQLLHKQSYHPKHTFSGILKSQILRFDRICSSPRDLETTCNILFQSLRNRGYNKRYLRAIKNQTLRKLTDNRNREIGSIKPCRGKLCRTCKFVPDTDHIKRGTEIINIYQNLTCNSRNLIYLIHCDSCGARYVGETGRTLRERFNGHRADVRLNKGTNVSDHFDGILCNFDNHCKLYPIEELSDTLSQEENKKQRLIRENFWIRNLKSYPPFGLNTGANANTESVMPLSIKYSSTAKIASKQIRSIFNELKEALPSAFGHRFITAYKRNKNLKDFLCSSRIRN